MVSLSFSFDDDCPQQVSEGYAIYLIAGPLQIRDDDRLFVKHEPVPLIELALWFRQWLNSAVVPTGQTFLFFPDSFHSALFQLAPSGDSNYQLAYLAYDEESAASYLLANYIHFRLAFIQFIADLADALQQRYNIRLENILQRFPSSGSA